MSEINPRRGENGESMNYDTVATQCPDCKQWFKSQSKVSVNRARNLALAKFDKHLPCPDAEPRYREMVKP